MSDTPTDTIPAAATSQPVQAAPKKRSIGKIIVLVLVLIILIGGLLYIALNADTLFGKKPTTGTTDQPITTTSGTIKVGTPGASTTVTEEGATEEILEEAFEEGDEVLYVFCEELNQGDSVSPMGDDPKYEVDGPVWFAYVDEMPDAWFEHDVKYIFIDSSTGEKTIYQESWPPDVNGEDMFDAAEDCGGASAMYAI
jgi:hypothetical protein